MKRINECVLASMIMLGVFFLLSCGKKVDANPSATNATDKEQTASFKLAGQGELTVSAPVVHENLAVYLIRGQSVAKDMKVMTLSEAMESKMVTVHETGEVNQLTIENKSQDHYVFIHSGDVVKGGKQDRTLANSMLLPPNTKPTPIQSFCVEQSRWAKRGNEKLDAFSGNGFCLSSKELKYAARSAKSQQAVWSNVQLAQIKLSSNVYKGSSKTVNSAASATSYQLTMENKDLVKMTAAYKKALSEKLPKDRDDVIGYAFVVNGEYNSADIYCSHSLFEKVWDIRFNGMVTEAIAELKDGDDKSYAVPTTEVIASALSQNQNDKAKEEVFAADNNAYVRENKDFVSYDAFLGKQSDAGSVRLHFNNMSKSGLKAPSNNQNSRQQINNLLPNIEE